MTPEAHLNDNVPAAYRGLERGAARTRADRGSRGRGAHRAHRGRTSSRCRAAIAAGRCSSRCSPTSGSSRSRRSRRRRSRRSMRGASASCPRTGRPSTSNGCATSRTGASAASSGGDTGFRPGTTPKDNGTSGAAKPKCAALTRSAPASPCGRTRTCSTPGSPRRSGRSRRRAGPGARAIWRPITRPRCS